MVFFNFKRPFSRPSASDGFAWNIFNKPRFFVWRKPLTSFQHSLHQPISATGTVQWLTFLGCALAPCHKIWVDLGRWEGNMGICGYVWGGDSAWDLCSTNSNSDTTGYSRVRVKKEDGCPMQGHVKSEHDDQPSDLGLPHFKASSTGNDGDTTNSRGHSVQMTMMIELTFGAIVVTVKSMDGWQRWLWYTQKLWEYKAIKRI